MKSREEDKGNVVNLDHVVTASPRGAGKTDPWAERSASLQSSLSPAPAKALGLPGPANGARMY